MALFIFNISMKHDLGFLLNRNTFLLQFLVQKTENASSSTLDWVMRGVELRQQQQWNWHD